MGDGSYEAEMEIVQKPNLISFSYLINKRHLLSRINLCNIHKDKYLIGTIAHPNCGIHRRQTSLWSSANFYKAVYKTKQVECFKSFSKRPKETRGKAHVLLSVRASLDDEFRSSQNIAISLYRRYRNVIERGCGDNLREFVKAGVTAYAVGCTDEGLRKELLRLEVSDVKVEDIANSGGSTGLKFKIIAKEIEECILWLSIIFITIMCTPQPTVVRWSRSLPVSAEIELQWKGFCAIIANAYFTRGMAWLPVKTLQLEQLAVMGTAEEPAMVAGRMRLVFVTLEICGGKIMVSQCLIFKGLQSAYYLSLVVLLVVSATGVSLRPFTQKSAIG
ncbi:uncharacterized protein LOC131064872 isoform X1 [Cryptomeria japonica]|uniref:uncharacterized protein LOC131064872 isoform X1 n=2 Tax=Cryptomeria japonica TaxID=3369 RepID=UPI0025ABA54C|nr:uncharacterized protein LOC131064872 isoform X1 [Cryptomeria japonica]XP_057855155.1 uncharacterized protein LOC131064872 isoform X1 [Cryptomeria japonica]XP_057855156.1 uncharacterized protein LOC131064872 isoform X1 [Cryptomeria japonica]XP_057855157.1 uncharacterized protein LOC131064872 isoform X1 [Cryptomeria japonica]